MTAESDFLELYSFSGLFKQVRSLTMESVHKRFDCTRRFVDVSRFVNRRWKYSMPYISSNLGLPFWKAVFDGLPRNTACLPDLYSASITRALAVAQDMGSDYAELMRYEDFRNNVGNYTYHSASCKSDEGFYVGIDLESSYMTLMFYGRASVPEFLYQELIIEPGRMVRKVRV
ncbi:hypothetical protein D3C81_630410 [compost metagenome]